MLQQAVSRIHTLDNNANALQLRLFSRLFNPRNEDYIGAKDNFYADDY